MKIIFMLYSLLRSTKKADRIGRGGDGGSPETDTFFNIALCRVTTKPSIVIRSVVKTGRIGQGKGGSRSSKEVDVIYGQSLTEEKNTDFFQGLKTLSLLSFSQRYFFSVPRSENKIAIRVMRR